MKKIILSTILASSALSSFNAQALITIDYSPTTNIYTSNGVPIMSLQTFGASYEQNPDVLAITPAYTKAIINIPAVRNNFVQILSLVTGGQLSSQDALEVANLLQQGINLGIATYEDYTRRFNVLLNEVVTIGLSNTSNEEKEQALDLFFSTFKSEFNNLEQSSAAQDYLASQIKTLQTALNSTDPVIKAQAQALLNEFNSELEFYAPNVDDASKLTPVQTPETKTTEAIFISTNLLTSIIDNRMSAIGVASGENAPSYGLWTKGTISTGEQKTLGLSDGYKFELKGATVGFDIGEDNVLGAAYSYFDNDVKSKLNASNKTKIAMHIATLYGKLNLSNKAFLAAQAHYGQSNIKQTRASNDSQNHSLDGKTKAHSFAGSVNLGVDYMIPGMEGSHLVPTIGVGYNKIDVKGYTETGTGLKRTVDKREVSRTSGLFGLMYAYDIKNDGNTLTPEIHANVDYAFNQKSDDTVVTLIQGVDPIIVPAEKQLKGLYTFGGSVKFASSQALEISAGYDFGVSKKYQSHTGTLKVRVNL